MFVGATDHVETVAFQYTSTRPVLLVLAQSGCPRCVLNNVTHEFDGRGRQPPLCILAAFMYTVVRTPSLPEARASFSAATTAAVASRSNHSPDRFTICSFPASLWSHRGTPHGLCVLIHAHVFARMCVHA